MEHTKRFLAALALIALGFGLCSCSTPGAPTPAPAAAPGHADSTTSPEASSSSMTSCTAITQTEAGAALGQTVGAPVLGKATVEGGIACVFYGPSVPAGADPDVPVADSVRVVLVKGPAAVQFFDDYRAKVPAQRVSGLGSQAYWDGSASLSVLEGSDYIRIAVIGITDVENAEKALAADALQRM